MKEKLMKKKKGKKKKITGNTSKLFLFTRSVPLRRSQRDYSNRTIKKLPNKVIIFLFLNL